jgi:urease accessory protein
VFEARGGATDLVGRRHRGPLVVQRPFFPEGRAVCHVVLLHPPGGIVGGDRLRIDVDVGAGASALVTTPAAAKIYRSAGAVSGVRQALRVAAGGALEWLPNEGILHDGAAVELHTSVELEPGARFIGIDMLCFGLPARGERWTRGRCRQRIELARGGSPLAIERGVLDGGAAVHDARWGLGGAGVLATLFATPAAPPPVIEALRARAASLPPDDLAGVTLVGGGEVVACRYLGSSAERARGFLHQAWSLLRPAVIGRQACAPRIWAT